MRQVNVDELTRIGAIEALQLARDHVVVEADVVVAHDHEQLCLRCSCSVARVVVRVEQLTHAVFVILPLKEKKNEKLK